MRKNVTGFLIMLMLCGALPQYLLAHNSAEHDLSLKDAMGLARARKYDEAIAEIQQLIQKKQDTGTIVEHQHLGFVYFRARQYNNAIDEFSKTIAMEKNSPMAYYFMALIYEKKAINSKNRGDEQDLESKALQAWRDFMTYSGPSRIRPESHRNIGISVKESIRRAERHIRLLEEGLRHEKK